MKEVRRPRPLLDWVFIVAFPIFAFTSLILEQWIVWGVDLRTATDPLGRAWGWYAESLDPLLLDRLLSIRVMFGIDAFVFGPFYLVLFYAILRRRNWIRIPALLFSSAMFYSVVVYILMEAFSEHAADTDFVMVLLIGAPYTIAPILLAYRMWNPYPFGAEAITRAT
ncbi:MAG: hypothetical protein PVH76_05855 [Myxococcales bacterium]|jgi:hypothetical protein